jgi:hypothetical protein
MTCKDCLYWHKGETNPMALNEVRGECRGAPPGVTILPQPNGSIISVCGYPQVPPGHAVCRLFEERTKQDALNEMRKSLTVV